MSEREALARWLCANVWRTMDGDESSNFDTSKPDEKEEWLRLADEAIEAMKQTLS